MMNKPNLKLKEFANKKEIKKIIRKLKDELIPLVKKYTRIVSEFLVRTWSKSMKSFASLNLRNQTVTVFVFFIVSFYSGVLFGNNNSSTQLSSNNSSRSQQGKCDQELWKRVNIQCRGDANCAGRTYREASGGDVAGGIDCITKGLKNKVSTFKKMNKSSEYNFLK